MNGTRLGKRVCALGVAAAVLLLAESVSAVVLADGSDGQRLRKDIQKQQAKLFDCLWKAALACEQSGDQVAPPECSLSSGSASPPADDPPGFLAQIARCRSKVDYTRKSFADAVTDYEVIGCPGDSVPGGSDQPHTDLIAYQTGAATAATAQVDDIAAALAAAAADPGICGSGTPDEQNDCGVALGKQLRAYAKGVLKCVGACENDYRNRKGNGGPSDAGSCALDPGGSAQSDAGHPLFDACVAKHRARAERKAAFAPPIVAAIELLHETLNDATVDLFNENEACRIESHPLVTDGRDVATGVPAMIPRLGPPYTATLPPMPRTRVTLEVVARYDCQEYAGSNFALTVSVNGVAVTDLKDRAISRLVNKDLIARNTPATVTSWYDPLPGPARSWLVLYGPGYGPQGPHFQDDPYRTVFDVTDLVDDGGANTISLGHSGYESTYCTRADELAVATLTAHVQSGGAPSVTMLPPIAPSHVVNTGTPGRGAADYAFTLHAGGGFSVAVGARRWDFSSVLSYPNAGFNALLPSTSVDTGGQAGWTVSTSSAPGTGSVVANGPSYEIERLVTHDARKISVFDTIRNTTAAPIGLIVRNEVSLAGLENAPVRLAGASDTHVRTYPNHRPLDDAPSGSTVLNHYYAPTNPTVHVEGGDHAIGIVAEGLVYRNQAKLYTAPGRGNVPQAGIKTDMLRLASGSAVTIAWSVYPVDGIDYFDFVNMVRADWGANLTTKGPWFWGFHVQDVLDPWDPTVGILANPAYRIRFAVQGGGWLDKTDTVAPRKIGFGAGVFGSEWASYRGLVVAAVDTIHADAPDARVLLYFDEQRDSYPDSPTRFSDSHATVGPGGPQEVTVWEDPYLPGENYFRPVYGVVPINGPTYGDNSFGREMLHVAGRYVSGGSDGLRADGLYCDEMEATSFGTPQLTYNRSDGHSALIHPNTFTIFHDTVGLKQLLSEEHHLQWISMLQSSVPFAGGATEILGNGPSNLPSLLATGVQRMVEAQQNDLYPSEGQLQTPLGYLAQGETFAHIQRLLTFGLLPVGTPSTDWPKMGPAMAEMFPFTPIELHMGYVLGVERIVTAHGGTYGWPDDASLVLPHFFGPDGTRITKAYTTAFSPSRTATTFALATSTSPPPQYTGGAGAPGHYDGELAVLERLPIDISGNGSLTGVRYDDAQIEIAAVASSSAWTLRVRNGRFEIVAGEAYEVTIGSTTTTVVAGGSPTGPVLTVTGTGAPILVRPL